MMKLVIVPIMLTSWGYIFKNNAIDDKYETAYTGLVVVIIILMMLF